MPDATTCYALGAALIGAGAVAAGVRAIVLARRSEPTPARHRPRHYEDTVEIRPAGWMPPIGARRIAAALDETAVMRAVDEEADR